jgi:hypothetical protein
MASGSTTSGFSASAATSAICSCQLEWQTQDKQVKALHEDAADSIITYSIFREMDLGLVLINQLKQLRKYIFNIEIERIQF